MSSIINIKSQREIFIMTNSIQHTVEVLLDLSQNKKIRTISVAKFLAEIITIISEEKSLSDFRGSR